MLEPVFCREQQLTIPAPHSTVPRHVCEPQSHSLVVPSLPHETIFLPLSTIAVSSTPGYKNSWIKSKVLSFKYLSIFLCLTNSLALSKQDLDFKYLSSFFHKFSFLEQTHAIKANIDRLNVVNGKFCCHFV